MGVFCCADGCRQIRFRQDLATRLDELNNAIDARDTEQARKTTHALCGIASAFGAVSLENHARHLHDHADQIFAMMESGALDKLQTLAADTEATLSTLFHEPRQYRYFWQNSRAS